MLSFFSFEGNETEKSIFDGLFGIFGSFYLFMILLI